MFHDLERRRLFSQLMITGTSFADAVELNLAGQAAAGVDVAIHNAGAQTLLVTVDGKVIGLRAGRTVRTEQILPGGIDKISLVDLGAGNDSLVTGNDLAVPMLVSGGRGNDNLKTGGGIDVIDGGAGNDTLYGQSGNDTLFGNRGNDSLLGQSGDDSLVGGLGDDGYVFGTPDSTQTDTVDEAVDGGSDELDFGTGSVGVVVDMLNDRSIARYSNGDATRTIRTTGRGQAANFERVAGSPAADRIFGNTNANTIFGAGGPDFIFGAGGDDSIDGGSGNDTISGGDGDDYLSGAIGDDTVGGDAGNDFVVDYTGSNKLDGGDGDDFFINQNSEVDTVSGGTGFDSVQDDDTSSSTSGLQNDIFSDAEYVYDAIGRSTAGNANLQTATNVADTSPAASHSMLARAVAPSETVVDGVSVSLDNRGVLRIVGTSGTDVIALTQIAGNINIEVNRTVLATPFPLASIRRASIATGEGNDVVRLISASGRNPITLDGVRVSGGAGDDTIIGGDGNDILAGELGNDSISGGAGNDIVNGDFVVLLGETAPAAAQRVDGTDTIDGGLGSTDIVTYTYRTVPVGIDLREVGAVSGSKGERDVLTGVEYLVTGQANDAVNGSPINDTIFGGPGDDNLAGGAGADRIFGGIGSDYLNPNGGADYLDTGGDDGFDDTINGTLDNDGFNPTNVDGVLVSGTFDHQNDDDFFALSNRRYSVPA